jgi:hypothetical protein
MKKFYHVCGNKKNGWRIAVPSKARVSDVYRCVVITEESHMNLDKGMIVYIPVVKE